MDCESLTDDDCTMLSLKEGGMTKFENTNSLNVMNN